MDAAGFLWQSIRNFKEMGTVVHISPAMCKKMTAFIDHEKDKIIIELGAGDGVITQYILDKMAPDARLYSFEINEELCATIREKINDSRLVLINGSAENVELYMQQYGVERVDHIISALPFVLFPEALTENILMSCRRLLKQGHYFIQMHYTRNLIKIYQRIFGQVKVFSVLINIPPGYVFKCGS